MGFDVWMEAVKYQVLVLVEVHKLQHVMAFILT